MPSNLPTPQEKTSGAKLAGLLALTLTLAACGSGGGTGGTGGIDGIGGNGGTGGTGGTSPLQSAEFKAELETAKTDPLMTNLPGAVAVLDKVSEVIDMADPASTALAGTATYKGGMVAGGSDDVGGYSVRGDMTLNADFDSSKVTGSFDNITGYDESDAATAAYTGTVDIDGTIDGARLTANLDGSVTEGSETWIVGGTLDGEFRGAGAEGVAGEVKLIVDGDEMIGAFAGEKE